MEYVYNAEHKGSFILFTFVKVAFFTFVNMENAPTLKLLFDNYSSFRNDNLFGRYITFQNIFPELKKLPPDFQVEEIGKSFLQCPIHSCTFGSGPIKILAWSQMHGNESTTTKAVFDLFNLFKKGIFGVNSQYILENCQIKIIPMLNPDGAIRYTRENANGADLNRDAQIQNELESRVLKRCLNSFQPDFCFNLHDQRTIYSAGNQAKPATLSFLAPAVDEVRTINEVRKKAMQIIAAVNNELQEILPGQIGRYDDSFNINCSGDTIQKRGIPTILFEAGHYYNDYAREKSRKFVLMAIFLALENIASEKFQDISINEYFSIPQNENLYCDVLLKNGNMAGNFVDVAIQFEEKIKSGKIAFQPVIQKIGPNLPFFGHQEIECEGNELKNPFGKNLVEGEFADHILLKNIKISIKNG